MWKKVKTINSGKIDAKIVLKNKDNCPITEIETANKLALEFKRISSNSNCSPQFISTQNSVVRDTLNQIQKDQKSPKEMEILKGAAMVF